MNNDGARPELVAGIARVPVVVGGIAIEQRVSRPADAFDDDRRHRNRSDVLTRNCWRNDFLFKEQLFVSLCYFNRDIISRSVKVDKSRQRNSNILKSRKSTKPANFGNYCSIPTSFCLSSKHYLLFNNMLDSFLNEEKYS